MLWGVYIDEGNNGKGHWIVTVQQDYGGLFLSISLNLLLLLFNFTKFLYSQRVFDLSRSRKMMTEDSSLYTL